MIPVPQTKHGPVEGNCWAACVASILHCSIEDVRVGPDDGTGAWFVEFIEWLNKNYGMGLSWHKLDEEGRMIDESTYPDKTTIILCGPSRNGDWDHAVVGRIRREGIMQWVEETFDPALGPGTFGPKNHPKEFYSFTVTDPSRVLFKGRSLQEFAEQVSEVVAVWPKWKQELLGGTAK